MGSEWPEALSIGGDAFIKAPHPVHHLNFLEMARPCPFHLANLYLHDLLSLPTILLKVF